jgi:hypothetical protein
MRLLSTICIVVIGLGVAATGRLACAEIKVIANHHIVAVSATSAEIKAIFLETKTSLSDGSRVQPVILKGSACDIFARNYLGKSAIGLQTYYRGLVFSGTGVIPKMFTSETDVIEYVARTRGAVAFVSAAAKTDGVKILDVR